MPAIFGSHMVLQRDQKDRVWGWAEPGEEVTVKIAGQSQATKAGPDGSWQVMLEPMPAGGPHVLSIQGKNTIKLDDVLVGEVWICSGQSNMQWSVAGAKDADLELATAKYPTSVDHRAQSRHAGAAEGFPGLMANLPAGDGRRLFGGGLLLRAAVAPDAGRAGGAHQRFLGRLGMRGVDPP